VTTISQYGRSALVFGVRGGFGIFLGKPITLGTLFGKF